jgi:hypothetical protein
MSHLYIFLPTKVPNNIRPARADYIHQAFRAELKSRGFFLLEKGLIPNGCSSIECLAKSNITKRYPIAGFIELDLKSSSRTEFLVGFYNEITGTLRLKNPKGEELVSVEHKESKRGGILFNSGQVLQAFAEHYENYGDFAFNHLADNFARTVVGKIPKYSSLQEGPETLTVAIHETKATEIRPGIYNLCATGSSGAVASLITKNGITNLREIKPGNYCGTYYLVAGVNDLMKFEIELRSAYGNATRKPLVLDIGKRCKSNMLASIMSSPRGNTIELQCLNFSTSSQKSYCSVQNGHCLAREVNIYKALSRNGPYSKVKTIRKLKWTDRANHKNQEVAYKIVVIDQHGSAYTAASLEQPKSH